MLKGQQESELKSYLERLNNLQKDSIRIEGIVLYLQDKIKNLQKSDLTNT